MSSDSESLDHTPALVGYVLQHNYVLLKHLGSGSFAEVWMCYSLKDHRYYAMKIQNEEDYDEAEKEVQVLKKIRAHGCPALTQLVTDFEHQFKVREDKEESICMVLPLMAGSLTDVMHRGSWKHGLPIESVKKIARQVLEALQVMHEELKMIHTDVKPDNILISGITERNRQFQKALDSCWKMKPKKRAHILQDRLTRWESEESEESDEESESESSSQVSTDSEYSDEEYLLMLSEGEIEESDSDNSDSDDSDDELFGSQFIEEPKVCLGDFGNSMEVASESQKEIQTRYYRAPEVLLGAPYDTSVDMWSFGCVLYELLTGEILFDPEKTSSFSRDQHHLLRLIQQLGPVPSELITEGRRSHLFFRQDGLLRGFHAQKEMDETMAQPWTAWEIEKKLSHLSVSDQQEFLDLFHHLVRYQHRYTASEALAHPFLSFQKTGVKSCTP